MLNAGVATQFPLMQSTDGIETTFQATQRGPRRPCSSRRLGPVSGTLTQALETAHISTPVSHLHAMRVQREEGIEERMLLTDCCRAVLQPKSCVTLRMRREAVLHR